MKYLVNALSLSMFNLNVDLDIGLYVKQMTPTDFCREIDDSVISAIGHQATAQLISTLCSKQVNTNRVEVKLNDKDELLVIQLLTRLPEGKILSADEIMELMSGGLVKLLKIKVSIFLAQPTHTF